MEIGSRSAFGARRTSVQKGIQRTFFTDAGNGEPNMPNWVKADFCIRHRASAENNYNLLLRMQRLGFVFIRTNSYIQADDTNYFIEANAQRVLTEGMAREAAEKMVHPGYATVDLLWRVGERTYEAMFIQWIRPNERFWRCSFYVDEYAFFSTSGSLKFESTASEVFHSFRSGIVEVVRHLAPAIGFADYEVDYYCEGPRDDRGVGLRWGNYLSWSILNRWSPGDMATLLEEADITTEIADRGLLFFFFPFLNPFVWSKSYIHRLMQIRELYDRNSVWSVFGGDG